jgi:hypothetical protein
VTLSLEKAFWLLMESSLLSGKSFYFWKDQWFVLTGMDACSNVELYFLPLGPQPAPLTKDL